MGGGYVPKKIAEIKMDGTDSRILIQENLNEPGYLTKDPTSSVLYWSESYFGKVTHVSFSIKNAFLSKFLQWGACGVMAIVVGNEHGDTSSNPGRDWLHFT